MGRRLSDGAAVDPGPTRTQQAFECALDNSRSAQKRRMSPAEVARAVFAGVQVFSTYLLSNHHRFSRWCNV